MLALFGSAIAVGTGYISLIYKNDRFKADACIGYLMCAMVMGRSLGGIFTVMFPAGLFLPLLPAASVNVVALLVVYKYVLDPGKLHTVEEEATKSVDDSPVTFDKVGLANVIISSFFDNIGSSGIVRK